MKSSALFLFLLFLFSFLTTKGQTIERKVINTSGTSFNINAIRIKTSIGEPIVGKKGLASGVYLSQGFFTGNSIRTETEIPIIPNNPTIGLYPDPAIDIVYLNKIDHQDLQVEVRNILGQTAIPMTQTDGSFSVKAIESGIYIASIYDKQGKLLQSTRFIKQ